MTAPIWPTGFLRKRRRPAQRTRIIPPRSSPPPSPTNSGSSPQPPGYWILQTATRLVRAIRQHWLVSTCATLFTASVCVYEWQPRVAVDSGTALDKSNPWSAPFELTNAGKLPLRDVEWLCSPNLRYRGGNVSSTRIPGTYGGATVIGPFKSAVIDRRVDSFMQIDQPLEAATIDLCVRFRLPKYADWLPFWTHTSGFRFTFHRDSDGAFTWLPRGESETADCIQMFHRREERIREFHRDIEEHRRRLRDLGIR
jgi:hypothetical protein